MGVRAPGRDGMLSPRALAAVTLLLGVTTLGTAPFARGVGERLRAMGALGSSVTVLLVSAALLVARLLPTGRRGPLLLWVLGTAAFAAVFALPEERLHVGQYALLGALLGAWRAMVPPAGPSDRRTRGLALAWVLPILDEGFQALLPARHWDPTDVLADWLAMVGGRLLTGPGTLASWCAAVPALLGLVLVPFLRGLPLPAPMPKTAADPRTFPVRPAHAPPAEPLRPHAAYPDASVLLVTVDALRRDAVPPWAQPALPLPAFRRLAGESLSAEDARANSLWTSPGIISLLTGLHPATHGVVTRGLAVQPGLPLPLEVLAAGGFTVSGQAGDDEETYAHLGIPRSLPRDRPPEAPVLEAAEARRSFLWLHLRQIHAPYDATAEELRALSLPSSLPEDPFLDRVRTAAVLPRRDFPGSHRWLSETLRALYSKEVHDADQALGAVLRALDESGLARRSILIVTADHGEELGERDGVGHASTTLDSLPQPELVQIPLWIRLPDGRGAGRILPGVTEQIDVMPTLLSLLGVVPPMPPDGQDRSAAILRAAAGEEPMAEPVRGTLILSSPCGWQCPEDRRGERVHGWVQGPAWETCRREEECGAELRGALRRFRDRGFILGSPVAAGK